MDIKEENKKEVIEEKNDVTNEQKEVIEEKNDVANEQKAVSEENSTDATGISMGLKIAIGAVAVLILGLTSWAFYQGGKRSIAEDDKVNTSAQEKAESKTKDLIEPTENVSGSSDNTTEQPSSNTQVTTESEDTNTSDTSGKTLSEDAVDDMAKELDDINTEDDDMAGVEGDLTSWTN